uniref:Uncharacterized protein n=1 Tax=Cannabis sativa TaxID=3483 RepID=A0A803Q896_CANSA
MDDGIEPALPYGPSLKASAFPTSNCDCYRIDFSKGNAWPLLTRLARTTIKATIPNMLPRPLPNPPHLLIGESSHQQQDNIQNMPNPTFDAPLSTSSSVDYYYGSDHRALLANIYCDVDPEQQKKRRSQFHFERMWFNDAECGEVIVDCWHYANMDDGLTALVDYLNRCAVNLQKWHNARFGQ